MDIRPDFHSIVQRGSLVCFDGEDTIASEEHIISDDEMPLSCSIIVRTFKSSSEVHSFPRSGAHHSCPRVFGLVMLPEV